MYEEMRPTSQHPWEISKSMSTEELKKIMLEHLDSYLDLLPLLSNQEVTIQDMNDAQPGIYRTVSRPSLRIIQDQSLFLQDSPEFGIFLIKGRWLIVKGNSGKGIELPIQLEVLEHSLIFQLDMHTHPGNDLGSGQPSDKDINKLNSTIDLHQYIASSAGLHEYQYPINLPGGYTELNDVNKSWVYWIKEDLGLSEAEFNIRGGWELKEEFFRQFFGLRTISWDDEMTINEIFKAKESLSI